MTHEDWEAATAPKIRGTWNLHTAFADSNLDFFVLFSSISGIVGNPGQANYASANTFLDAFVQFRHGKGLSASVLDVGVMDNVGYVSQNQAVMEHLKARAAYLLQEQALLDSLELAIKRSSPQVDIHTDGYFNKSQLGIGFRMTQPISSPENRAIWKQDIRMSVYHNLEVTPAAADADKTSSAPDNDILKDLLTAATNNPDILTQESSIAVISKQG